MTHPSQLTLRNRVSSLHGRLRDRLLPDGATESKLPAAPAISPVQLAVAVAAAAADLFPVGTSNRRLRRRLRPFLVATIESAKLSCDRISPAHRPIATSQVSMTGLRPLPQESLSFDRCRSE